MRKFAQRGAAAFGLMACAAMAHGQVTIYQSGFEGTNGGWVGTGDWERGVVNSGFTQTTPPCDNFAINPPPSAFEGMECWGTNIAGCHSSNQNATLSRTFDLTTATSTRLKFWNWQDSGGNTFDMCIVRVNGNDVFLGSGTTGTWQEEELDLSAFDGNPSVQVQFVFVSTGTVNRSGWYVDDVRLEAFVPAGVNYTLELGASASATSPGVAACDVTFLATVSNIGGTGGMAGGSFSAALPFNADFVSGSGASLDMGSIVATIPALNPGQMHSFSFVLNANADGLMSVMGTVSPVEMDVNPANNTATAIVEASSVVPNDNCCSARNLNLETFPFNVLVDNSSALDGPNAGSCTTLDFGRNDFWFVYTASANGALTMTETGGQDIAWGVFESCGSGSIQCLATDATQSVSIQAGQTRYIQVSAQTLATSVFTPANITFGFLPAPANDVCSTAEVIMAMPFSASGVVNLSSTNSGNIAGCENFGDVWYKWTATATGALRLNESAGQNAAWAMYEGPDCDSLTLVACTTSDTNVFPSVIVGNTYWFRLGADTAATARTTALNFTIELFSPPPANDMCATAQTIVSMPLADTVSNQSATNSGNIAGCENFGDIWYRWVATDTGSLRLNESSGHNAAWSMYEGADCGSMTLVHCTLTDTAQYPSVFVGNTYWIRLGSDTLTTVRTTSLAFTIELFAPAPANDTCATAETIVGLPFGATVDNQSATNSGSVNGCNAFGDIWYEWVATDTGRITVTETGTQNASWAIYEGDDCGSMFNLLCTLSDTNQSAPVIMGNTYKIRVGTDTAFLTRTPALTFTIDFVAPPANDECSGAVPLDLVFGGFESPGAISANDDPDIDCNGASPVAVAGVWYTFTTGPEGGVLNVNETSTAAVATQLYTGDCNSLSTVPGSCSTAQNRNFTLDANTTYFMIMSMNGSTRPTVNYVFSYLFTPATGACCNGTSCSIATFTACVMGGGTYQGDNTPCIGAPNYVSPDGPIAIPDASGSTAGVTQHTVTISDAGTVSTIDVQVDVAHTFGGDVILRLIAPDLTQAKLLTRPGRAGNCEVTGTPFGSGNTLNGVYIFSDTGLQGANEAVVANTTLPSGTYRATDCENVFVDLNTVFGGVPLAGTWTLQAEDWGAAITGQLRAFALSINGGLAPPCDSVPCPGDYNDDGVVDLGDLLDFLGDWNPNLGQSGMGLPSDINNDGTVDLADLLEFLGDWNPNLGSTCP